MIATQSDPVRIIGPLTGAEDQVLTPQAIRFLVKLSTMFEPRRRRLLAGAASSSSSDLDAGEMPDFPAETAEIRNGRLVDRRTPADLCDRRVEITGPDRPQDDHQRAELRRQRLHGGFRGFQLAHLAEHASRARSICATRSTATITYTSPEGKRYELCDKPAVLMVRPRGWHLVEKHFLVDGEPISASLFDFGLYFFHNAQHADRGTARARISICRRWRAIWKRGCGTTCSCVAQDELGIPRGTIRATVLIETILAAFEMDEILWELREHSAGLNCGRWDYIFSFIKKFRNRPDFVLPDRAQVTMDQPLPELVCGPADPDLPPARHARHGRHGGADSDQERSGSQRGGAGSVSARTSCAKCGPGTTAPGWRIPAWFRSRSRCSTRTCRTPNQIDTASRHPARHGGGPALRSDGANHRGRACR